VVPARAAPSIQHTSDPGRAALRIRFGCFLPPPRSSKDLVVSDVLQELIDADLRQKLRNELGVTYTVNVTGEVLRGGTSVLEGQLDASPAGHDAVLSALDSWLTTTGPPPADQALARARWHIAQDSVLGAETNLTLARRMFRAWNEDLPVASLDRLPQDLADIGPADVNAALAACRASAVVSVLGPD
jgi:predicted Zn-dependent peptidase